MVLPWNDHRAITFWCRPLIGRIKEVVQPLENLPKHELPYLFLVPNPNKKACRSYRCILSLLLNPQEQQTITHKRQVYKGSYFFISHYKSICNPLIKM